MQLWRYSAATDVGLQRTNNEDSFLSCPEIGLWIVADGMGGHAAGEVASAIVAQTVNEQVLQGATLAHAIQASHRAVLQAAANGQGGQGMGSTAVALLSNKHHYEVAWVGDSRAYLWHQDPEPTLTQLTVDHSYVQMLYQTGAITEAELDTHPERNIITQCLGSIELNSVKVDSKYGDWDRGEKIILCSDGLSDAVSAYEINSILTSYPNVHQATSALIDAALAQGGRDNITVIVVEYPQGYTRVVEAVKHIFRRILPFGK